jgi:hypothetical protein
MAPAFTSSPAFTVARFSSRSLYMIEKMRLVSACTRRASSSWASDVMPGLSDM